MNVMVSLLALTLENKTRLHSRSFKNLIAHLVSVCLVFKGPLLQPVAVM